MTTSQAHTEETISADEANEKFTELLRHVCEGHSYTITSDGRPVARLVAADDEDAAREAAWRELMEHLWTVKPINAGKWTRDELYER